MENVCRFLRKLKIVAICANIPTPGHISVDVHEQPDEEAHRTRAGRVPKHGSFCPH